VHRAFSWIRLPKTKAQDAVAVAVWAVLRKVYKPSKKRAAFGVFGLRKGFLVLLGEVKQSAGANIPAGLKRILAPSLS
jgi:hypothetical protein